MSSLNNNDITQIPESYICPISLQIMRDPVMDPTDGMSYERDSLVEWVRKNGHSPMTRSPLTQDQIVPNRNLKFTIDQFRVVHPQLVLDHEQGLAESSASLSAANTIAAQDVAVEVPSAEDRKPLVLFAVIDNSGSMQLPCEDTPKKSEGGDAFSRLDMVKHSLNTIITSLRPHDSICVIKFHTTASVFLPLTTATDMNKRVLMDRLVSLQPECQTNIWDGVKVALDEIAKLSARDREKNVQIYLLTDGEPTINPPRPMMETVTSYMRRKLPLTAQPAINTFGYGYQLDSQLLFSLAEVGRGGAFGFIPDASMVGTVFINALSNSFYTDLAAPAAQRAHITAVMVEMSAHLVSLLKNFCLSERSTETEKLEVLNAFVESVRERLARIPAASQSPSDAKDRAFLEDLALDCTPNADASLGQIAKAVQSEYFSKWGSHYLRSVVTSFHHLICTNFKDKAMQHFRSERFIEEQGRVEEVFLDIAPPKPSISNRRWNDPGNYGNVGGSGSSGSSRTRAAPAAPSMTRYYDASGGCFSADSQLFVVNERNEVVSTAFDKLQPGMRVLTAQGESAVETVVKMKYTGELYALGASVRVTPFHPVRIDGQSFFPQDLFANEDKQRALCGSRMTKQSVRDVYVYDVVLANRSLLQMPVKGEKSSCTALVATWGHSEKKDPVFAHDYFGSEAIVRDLQSHGHYTKGIVTIDKPTFVRDNDTLKVVKIAF